jgi:O-antigen/teichoic acid export membrane protein
MATPSKNIFWLSVSRVFSLGLLFLAYTQLFRYLGPQQSGQFQFVLSYVTLFGVVIDFGIQQYIIKKISEDRAKAKQYFHSFLAVEAVLALFVYAVMIGVAFWNGYEPIVLKAIIVAGLGTTLHGLTYPFLAVITAFYDLKKAALLNFISSVINVTIIFLTIWIKGSIVLLVTQQVIYALLAMVMYYRYVQVHIGKPEILKGILTLRLGLVKQILKASLPFALLVGFSTIYNRIDVIIISHILGYTQTGLYTAAYRFFDLLGFFPAVVSHALYPVFATMMANNQIGAVRETLEKYLRFMAAVALPMATGGMLLSESIIRILAGEQFIAAAHVLAVLIWAPAVLFLYVVMNALVISQLTRYATYITGFNVLVNIVGNILLLPRYGIIAAAATTILSETLQGGYYFYLVKKKITQFTFFRNIWQPFVAAGVMGIVVFFLRDQFILIPIIVGAIVYGLLLFSFGFFKKEDWQYLAKLLRRGYEPDKI